VGKRNHEAHEIAEIHENKIGFVCFGDFAIFVVSDL